MLDKFAEHLGPSHTTKKYPLPSNTADRLVKSGGDLSAEEQWYLNNIQYRSLLGTLYMSMNTREDISYIERGSTIAVQLEVHIHLVCKVLIHLVQHLRGTVCI